MSPTGQDPHRTLGVPPGAGEAEIKRAYRALAKRYHPDARNGSAGRFIEIQAAYEALLGTAAPGVAPGPRAGRRPAQPADAGTRAGAGAGPGPGPGPGAGAPAGSAWARGPRGGGPRRPGTQAAPGSPPRYAGRPDADDAPPPGASRRSGPGSGHRHGHGPRRATLGSTSYDEAEEVFEPDWSGGAWYGASSGTHWTINPKEYADPRKHGPEYQARARRRAAGDPPREEAPLTGDLPPAWQSRTWTAAGDPDDAPPTFEHEPPPPPPGSPVHGGASTAAGRPRHPAGDPGASGGGTDSVSRSADGPGIAARIVLALAGWAVPGLALAALVGLPGGLLATLPVQAAGVALLAFRPHLAWTAAGGGLALVLAAIPIVAFVAALGGPVTPGEPMPGAALLATLAWGGGIVAVGSGRVAPFPWRHGG